MNASFVSILYLQGQIIRTKKIKRKMFTCIACRKPEDDGGEEKGGTRGSGTPSTKEAVKSLTAQIKDIALKFSGPYRQCKPCTGSSSYKKGHRPYPDFDAASEGVPYPYLGGGSSSSTPAWDFTGAAHHPATGSDSRFTGVYGGDRESISAQSCDVVLEDDDQPKEWMAQVEPGVHITFVSLPNGGNDLKRIRFSRDMFNKWQAQRWWGENYDRIMELYNVQRFNRQALHTPPRSEDERDSSFSRMTSARESPMAPSFNKEWTPRNYYKPAGIKGNIPSDHLDHGGNQNYNAGASAYGSGGPRGDPSMEASRMTTSSRDEPSFSISNASEVETEWVEQDEPGVYITIRLLADGTRELRRVRFSREKFGEVHAKTWWEGNRERIQAQYL
ncbi:BRX domain-containing protein/BRX_N domain-containing protein [Cephalotus follicularis]|uniref:BRX domain-containing protein/BRX_N domain-containing protein n=1 Tax=Cephalotus follicularis TaxID=3775 RepID=A0A1Q3D096_CEPFO|nr:BRX domain-containing protein/BRX_N domain-containing protein [Cephalotus follicularis]